MNRIRQQNVTAAQWLPNGSAVESMDLTKDENVVFGSNVFSPAVQKERLPADVYEQLNRTIAQGEALDMELADAVATAMKSQFPAGAKVVLKSEVNPSILGGLQIQIGDKFLDLSVGSRIEEVGRTPV